MTIERRPCQRQKPTKAPTFCFLVDLNKERALILDNFVWAVATKAIPIKEWRRNWKTVELPEDKIAKMLDSLAGYAVYSGMTPEAAEYLPQLVPMTQAAQTVALNKGKALLERYKTQAQIEEAEAKAGRPLAGAALIAKAKKILEEAEQAEASSPHKRNAGRAKALAEQVTKDLAEVEAAGEDPTKVLKDATPDTTLKAPKGFDPKKLKTSDGKWRSASSMFKGLLLEGKLDDDKIFKAVQKEFGLDDDKRSYVQWSQLRFHWT